MSRPARISGFAALAFLAGATAASWLVWLPVLALFWSPPCP